MTDLPDKFMACVPLCLHMTSLGFYRGMPRNMDVFLHRVMMGYNTSYPSMGARTTLHQTGDSARRGTLEIQLYDAKIKGELFPSVEYATDYLRDKGVCGPKTYLRHHTSHMNWLSYGVFIPEEFYYEAGNLTPTLVRRISFILRSSNPNRGWGGAGSHPEPLFKSSKGTFIYPETGETIPSGQWVPLYRKGYLIPTEGRDPFNSEEVPHVIF